MGEELEGWKTIAAALGVSHSTAKRLGSGDTGLCPMPTYRNLRGKRAIRAVELAQWQRAALDELARKRATR